MTTQSAPTPDRFPAIVGYLIDPDRHGPAIVGVDVERWLTDDRAVNGGPPQGDGPAVLAAAFLVALNGPDHPLYERAVAVLEAPPADAPAGLPALLSEGLGAIRREIGERQASDPAFVRTLANATARLAGTEADDRAASEAIWSILYPEAVGLEGDPGVAEVALRRRRIVQVDRPNPRPIRDPAREVLFTSNVLLGLPLEGGAGDPPGLDPVIAAAVNAARSAPQRYWFDHPIPIGVGPAANELLHGLRGLDAAMRAEPAPAGLGRVPATRRLTCLLSVSATHAELRDVARRFVELELDGIDALERLDVVVVT